MTPSFKNIPRWVVFLCCDQFCKAKGLLTLWRLWEMLQLLNCFCRFYFPAKNESWERHCGPGLTPFIRPTARVPLTQNSLWNILTWKSIFSKYLGSMGEGRYSRYLKANNKHMTICEKIEEGLLFSNISNAKRNLKYWGTNFRVFPRWPCGS